MTKQSIWTEYLGDRRARKVARALKLAGYTTATIAKCTGYTVNIAQYFEPVDISARHELLHAICQAAGIQP